MVYGLNLLVTLFRPGYFTSYFIAPGLFPHQDLLHCYIYMYNSQSNSAQARCTRYNIMW